MATREGILRAAKIAGYHGDGRAFCRALMVARPRVRFELLQAEREKGAQAKAAGVSCGCYYCQKAEGLPERR